MAKADTTSTRAPRGSKPVVQAFFSALNQVPEGQQVVVARAAQIMIRDELTRRRDKAKDAASAARGKSRQPAPAPRRQQAAPKPMPPAKKPGRGRPRRMPETEPVA